MSRGKLLVLTVGLGAALAGGLLTGRDAPAPAPTWPTTVPPPTWQDAEDGTTRMDVTAMGTLFTLIVGVQGEPAREALLEAHARLRELEDRLSSWRPDSDVARINDAAGVEPVEVGPDTLAMLVAARDLHDRTGGAVDVTIDPVWSLWPFRDPDRPLPTRAELDVALQRVDMASLVVDEEASTAFLARDGMRLNLGAIGKGYAAACLMRVFGAHGIEHAAVSAGGDLLLKGRKRSGPWSVAVEHPRWEGRLVQRFFAGDVAVATSGNSKRRILRGGREYGHILDPRTGLPARGVAGVTVLAADPVEADAFATAVFVMGVDAGLAWVEGQPGIEALIFGDDGRVERSAGWDAATADRPEESAAVVTPAPSATPAPEPARRTTPTAELRVGSSLREGLGDMVSLRAGHGADLRVDRTEVSNAAYARFLESEAAATHRGCHPEEPSDKDHTPRYWRADWSPPLVRASVGGLTPFDEGTFQQPDRPVVGVDWWDAYAFTSWAGKRLPTRGEWEAAAGAGAGRTWPWGDRWEWALANTGGEKWGEHDGHTYPAPVDSFPAGASPAGALHMAGNVAEWTREGWVMGGSSNSNPSGVRVDAGRLREPGYRSFDIGLRAASGGAR